MSRTLRRTFIVVFLVVAAAFVGLNVIAYIQARAMLRFSSHGPRTGKPEQLTLLQKAKVIFEGINIPRPESDISPAEYGLKYDTLTIPGLRPGIKLGAWYCPGESDSTIIILFHGYAADKSAMLREATALLQLGYSALLVDFRGSGGSSESYTTFGFDEAEDVAAAMQFVRENHLHARVILYGQSMGAAAVLRAVYKRGLKPDGIIVEMVFDRMLTAVEYRFRAMGLPPFPGAELLLFWGGLQSGFKAFSHNPVDYASSVSCPVLFLHGTDDDRAPIENARLVYEAVSGPKLFKAFPGVGHESIAARCPDDWKNAIADFLQRRRLPGWPAVAAPIQRPQDAIIGAT